MDMKEVQQSVAVMAQANSHEDNIARKSQVQRQKVKKQNKPMPQHLKLGEIFRKNQ